MILDILLLKKKKERKKHYTDVLDFLFIGYTQYILIPLAVVICCVVRSWMLKAKIILGASRMSGYDSWQESSGTAERAGMSKELLPIKISG